MVSLKALQRATSNSITEQPSSPRMSFSSNFFDERDFISICPNPVWDPHASGDDEANSERGMIEFEFLSVSRPTMMMPADQLFHQGMLLPFRNPPSPNPRGPRNMNWCQDDDPSPRPPKCTVMWKELLNLKKSRATSAPASFLPPSLSLSSNYSSSSSRASLSDVNSKDKSNDKRTKKKGKERMNIIRIRPAINVPICSQAKSSAFSPIFPLRKEVREVKKK